MAIRDFAKLARAEDGARIMTELVRGSANRLTLPGSAVPAAPPCSSKRLTMTAKKREVKFRRRAFEGKVHRRQVGKLFRDGVRT